MSLSTPFTDPYFRGFDNNFPDYYRFTEWERDFDANYARGGLPSLSLVRFMHDHTGSFGTAIDLVNTPETQQADNDYAVGLLVQKIANSIYANDTLIFVIEDDAQDGGDHVDSHRTIAFVAGAYVKQQAVVSTPYNTINFLRTIEEVLGLAADESERRARQAHGRHLQHHPLQLEIHRHALGLPLQYQPAAACQIGRTGRAQVEARREVLGARHQGNGLLGRRSARLLRSTTAFSGKG